MIARSASSKLSWFLALASLCAVAGCAADLEDVAVLEEAAKPPKCTVGALRCADGNTPEQCVAQGKQTVWVAQADCAGDTPVCSAGSCVCSEGAADCQGRTARQCVGGVWQTETCSGDAPICSGGQCTCQDQSTECADGVARYCMNGEWQAPETCELGCFQGSCAVNTISEPGLVSCFPALGLICSGATPFCSVLNYYTQFTCTATPASTSLACDGPNDCPEGFECCKGDYTLCGTSCRPAGTCGSSQCFVGRPDLTLCDPTAPSCATGTTCQRVEWVDSNTHLYACK